MSEFIKHNYQTGIFIGKLEPSYTLQFSNKYGVVGTLDFNQNPITFTGDTESSARVFFDYLIQVWPEMIKKHMEQHSGMVSVPAQQTVNQQLVQALEVVLECGSINDQWWLDKVRAALSAAQEQQ